MSWRNFSIKEVYDWALSLGKHNWNAHKCEKNYTCEFCEIIFLKSSQLNIHIIQKHTVGNYECNICGKRFLMPSALKFHFNSVHEGRKDYKGLIIYFFEIDQSLNWALHSRISTRDQLNEKIPFIYKWRSTFNEINDWVPSVLNVRRDFLLWNTWRLILTVFI